MLISNLNPCSQGRAGATSMGVNGVMDRRDVSPGRWRSYAVQWLQAGWTVLMHFEITITLLGLMANNSASGIVIL